MPCNLLLWLVCCSVLAACTGNAADESLAAEHSQRGTELASLRMTATVQFARLQTTLDFAQTQAAFAATQSQYLKATLITTGFAPDALDAFQRDVSDGRIVLPTATQRPENTQAAQRQLTQSALVTAPADVATPPPDDAPRLENIVLATGVQNDCAAGTATQFTSDTPEIYVVANGYNIPAGTKVASRWRVSGQDVTYDFTTAGDTNGECLWFYIDQTDFAFEPGTWDVTLSLNDVPATSAVSFTITAP